MPFRVPIALLVSALVLSAPRPSAAVDGVLEINLSCATGPGCFPGDTPGFPVEITTAGAFRLTGNLPVPDENTTAIAISVFNESITLDLNGFEIRGPNACLAAPPVCTLPGRGIGIDASKSGGAIAIRNGTIRGMGDSGVLADGGSTRVESLHLASNGDTAIVVGNDCSVRANVVMSNGGSGIITGEMCSIRENVVNNHAGDGISAGIISAVIDNVIRSAVGTELLMASSSTGYAHNVVSGSVSGGTQIGPNICNSALCP